MYRRERLKKCKNVILIYKYVQFEVILWRFFVNKWSVKSKTSKLFSTYVTHINVINWLPHTNFRCCFFGFQLFIDFIWYFFFLNFYRKITVRYSRKIIFQSITLK